MFGCKAQETHHIEEEDTTFLLKPKESTSFKSPNVRFDTVIEDSRCPEETQCIWAGEAKATISILQDGVENTQELVFGVDGINENNTKLLWTIETTEVHVIGLTPYPKNGMEIKPADYRLLLKKIDK